jgi:hypothetical protein
VDNVKINDVELNVLLIPSGIDVAMSRVRSGVRQLLSFVLN